MKADKLVRDIIRMLSVHNGLGHVSQEEEDQIAGTIEGWAEAGSLSEPQCNILIATLIFVKNGAWKPVMWGEEHDAILEALKTRVRT